jgi:hypothetical protein
MVVGNKEIGNGKNEGKSLAISIAMQTWRYDAGCIAQQLNPYGRMYAHNFLMSSVIA